MPIKPENKKLYPKDWSAIREEIKLRANNRCEICGVQNHAIGYRHDGHFVAIQHEDGVSWVGVPNDLFFQMLKGKKREVKFIKIVCTVMHLDHDPTNNGVKGNRKNLKFGCQKCHNEHDKEHRQKNAAQTRLNKAASNQLSLQGLENN